MKKIFLCVGLISMLLTRSFPALAQKQKIPRIGIVGGSQDVNNPWSGSNRLRQALRELGYVEGKNILIELRSALLVAHSGGIAVVLESRSTTCDSRSPNSGH
jgi:hypothetical protein